MLGGILAINKYLQSKNGESTFHEEFVKIDSSAVTQILIYPKAEKGKEIKITKAAKGWDLQNDKIKTVADSNAVLGLLANFSNIKSQSLAAENKSGWNDLQVTDTSGSRIKITTKDNQTYDIIVGKFGYNPATRGGVTYIRHANEEAVYAVEGYLAFTVSQGFNAWRNKTFIRGNKNNWSSLTFNYPGDSSFVLSKQNNMWTVNGEPADSTKTIQYLTELANTQSSSFVDQYTPASTPVFTLTISGNNQSSPITVLAYPADSVQKYILHSNLNPEVYFSEAQSRLTDRIFVGKQKFFKEEK